MGRGLAVSDRDHEAPEPATLFRLPLDGGAPSALTVAGTPVDQFSFLESEDGHINVLVQPEGTGDWMWTAERRRPPGADSLMLLRAPLARLDDGRARAPEAWYRAVPVPARGAFYNRFAGDHLLYGSGNGWWNNAGDERGTIFVVPWRGGDVRSLGLSHPVDRIEVMGPDAVVVGASGGDSISAVSGSVPGRWWRSGSCWTARRRARPGATGSSIGRTARAPARVSSGYRCAARGGRGGSTWSRGRRRSCS